MAASAPTSVKIKVKWNKEIFDVDVDMTAPLGVLKAQLYSLTKVPADRMKIMGLKTAHLTDDLELDKVGLTPGKTLMLIGTAEQVDLSKPADAPTHFREDQQGGHLEDEAMSNGLKNIANTCYLNSVVQVLRASPEYKDFLEKNTGGTVTAKELASLYKELDGTTDAVLPKRFWSSFILENQTFAQLDERGYPMQHDSQEALEKLLLAANVARADKDRVTAIESGKGTAFQGILEIRQVPIDGQMDKLTSTDANVEPFFMLPCNCAQDVTTIEMGIEDALTSTRMDAENAPLFKEISKIAALPEYLFVHIKRFTWRQDVKGKAKVLKPINFPMVLDASSLCTDRLKSQLRPVQAQYRQAADRRRAKLKQAKMRERQAAVAKLAADDSSKKETDGKDSDGAEEGEEQAWEDLPPPEGGDPISGYYELCGVVSHKGRSADHGHYVAWVRKGDAWLLFDDEHVARMPEEDVVRLKGSGEAHIAYVLMYRSRNPDTQRGILPL